MYRKSKGELESIAEQGIILGRLNGLLELDSKVDSKVALKDYQHFLRSDSARIRELIAVLLVEYIHTDTKLIVENLWDSFIKEKDSRAFLAMAVSISRLSPERLADVKATVDERKGSVEYERFNSLYPELKAMVEKVKS